MNQEEKNKFWPGVPFIFRFMMVEISSMSICFQFDFHSVLVMLLWVTTLLFCFGLGIVYQWNNYGIFGFVRWDYMRFNKITILIASGNRGDYGTLKFYTGCSYDEKSGGLVRHWFLTWGSQVRLSELLIWDRQLLGYGGGTCLNYVSLDTFKWPEVSWPILLRRKLYGLREDNKIVKMWDHEITATVFFKKRCRITLYWLIYKQKVVVILVYGILRAGFLLVNGASLLRLLLDSAVLEINKLVICSVFGILLNGYSWMHGIIRGCLYTRFLARKSNNKIILYEST